MAFINFTVGVDEVLANGLPVNAYFDVVDEAVAAMTVADVLGDHTVSAGTSIKTEAMPAPSGRTVTFVGHELDQVAATPKAIRLRTTNDGTAKIVCAWDLDGGAAVDLDDAGSPYTTGPLSFLVKFDGEA